MVSIRIFVMRVMATLLCLNRVLMLTMTALGEDEAGEGNTRPVS